MNKVLFYLDELLNDGDVVILATSGGPDSMCLFRLMVELQKEKKLKLVIAHVNHKLRSESEEEATFVKKEALALGLIYEYMEIKEYNHDNLENEARRKRYDFFLDLAEKYQAKYLFTAHHGDDLMETIMMRLVRGSSLKGYAGFSKMVDFKGIKLVRPLIELTKEEIEQYMRDNDFKYYVDKSNFSEDYTRNRYRKRLLPFLKEENREVNLKFLKFSRELKMVNDFVDGYIKEVMPKISDDKGIVISKLLGLDSFVVKRVVEYQLSLVYVNDLFLVSDRHSEAIIKLLKSDVSNGYINLPGLYKASKNYDCFRIVEDEVSNDYEFILEDKVLVPGGVIQKIRKSDSKSNYVIRLNSEEICLPLKVRNRRKGDKICVKNLNGSKKVKDILIDEKISRDKRDKIPVVTDSNNVIIWLPGVKKSKFDVERYKIYDIILSYEEE